MTEEFEQKPLRKQEEAIAALLIHPTVEAAAAAVGVSVDTLRRWQRDEVFAAAYRDARSAVVKQATTTLSSACSSAVETLAEVMTNLTYPPYSRIHAARMVLDYAHRGLELLDLSARVAELEKEEKHG